MAAGYAFTSIHIKGSSRAVTSMIGASIRHRAGKGRHVRIALFAELLPGTSK